MTSEREQHLNTARSELAKLSDAELTSLRDLVHDFTPEIVSDLLSSEPLVQLKFVRSERKIVIFPNIAKLYHAKFAVLSSMDNPDDAGFVNLNAREKLVIFYGRSTGLRIDPDNNILDKLQRYNTVVIASNILPEFLVK